MNHEVNEDKYKKYRPPELKPKPETKTGINKIENFIWDKAFLKSLEWKRYEEVCKEFLRLKYNCNAEVTNTGADGGIDIKLNFKNGKLLGIAQCKAWNKDKIGVNLIRELYGVMASENAEHGMFFTTSTYSNEALEFKKNNNKKVILYDSENLIRLINEMEEKTRIILTEIATQGDYKTPTCPKCDIKLVLRKTKEKEFWGCTNYPKCKNIIYVRNETKEDGKKVEIKIKTEDNQEKPTCDKCNTEMKKIFNPKTRQYFWGCKNYPECKKTLKLEKKA